MIDSFIIYIIYFIYYILYIYNFRYNGGKIYTYIGEVCVSINPYRNINIYDNEHINKYKGKKLYNNNYYLNNIKKLSNTLYKYMK